MLPSRKRKGNHDEPWLGNAESECRQNTPQHRPTKQSRLSDQLPARDDRRAESVVDTVVKPEPNGSLSSGNVLAVTRAFSLSPLATCTVKSERARASHITPTTAAASVSPSQLPSKGGTCTSVSSHCIRASVAKQTRAGHKRPLSSNVASTRGVDGAPRVSPPFSPGGAACSTAHGPASATGNHPLPAAAAKLAVSVAANPHLAAQQGAFDRPRGQSGLVQPNFALLADNSAHAHALAQISRSHAALLQTPPSQTRMNSAVVHATPALQCHYRTSLPKTLYNSAANSCFGTRPSPISPPISGSLFAAVSSSHKSGAIATRFSAKAHTHSGVVRSSHRPRVNSGKRGPQRGTSASTTPGAKAIPPPSPPLERLLTASAMKLIALDRRNKKTRESEAARLASYYREWKVHVTWQPRDINLLDAPSPLIIYGTGPGTITGLRLEVCASYKGSRVDSILVDWRLALLFDDYTPVQPTDEVISVVRRRYNVRTSIWHFTVNLHDVAHKNAHRRFLIKVYANSMIFESISDKHIGSYVGPFTVRPPLEPAPAPTPPSAPLPLVSPPSLLPSGSRPSSRANSPSSIAPSNRGSADYSLPRSSATSAETHPQSHNSNSFTDKTANEKKREFDADDGRGGHVDAKLQRLRQLNRVEMLIREQSELLRSISDVASSLNSSILHPAPPVHELPPAAHRRNSASNRSGGGVGGFGFGAGGYGACRHRHHRHHLLASPSDAADFDSVLPPPPSHASAPPSLLHFRHHHHRSSSGANHGASGSNSSSSSSVNSCNNTNTAGSAAMICNNPVAPPPSLSVAQPYQPRLPPTTSTSSTALRTKAGPTMPPPPSLPIPHAVPPPLDHLPREANIDV